MRTSAPRSVAQPPVAAPVPASAPAPTPEKETKTVRQTLDLPADDYDELHDLVRKYGRDAGLPRKFNAQAVLRVLVGRMLTDEELRAAVLQDAASRAVAT